MRCMLCPTIPVAWCACLRIRTRRPAAAAVRLASHLQAYQHRTRCDWACSGDVSCACTVSCTSANARHGCHDVTRERHGPSRSRATRPHLWRRTARSSGRWARNKLAGVIVRSESAHMLLHMAFGCRPPPPPLPFPSLLFPLPLSTPTSFSPNELDGTACTILIARLSHTGRPRGSF